MITISPNGEATHYIPDSPFIYLLKPIDMNSTTLRRNNKVSESVLNQPAISIILPFEPKMTPKSGIINHLKAALEKAQEEVIRNHKDDLGVLVMQKLRNLVKNLNFNTYKKSIAIYVSPVFEKVLYLDMPVESKIAINEPFDIRQLILQKKLSNQYLLLVLNEYCSSIYLGEDFYISKIKSNNPNYIKSIETEDPSKTHGPATAILDAIEERSKRIMCNADEGLSTLLTAYPLPVFVLGPENTVNYFKANTTHKKRILEYGYTNTDQVSPSELIEIVKPIVNDWRKIKMKYLQLQMEMAKDNHKLATGIGNVWKVASEGKGRLLLVEENYKYVGQLLESEDGLYASKESYHKYSHVRDTVDDIIEIVLENAGDVEFVEKGLLDHMKHIALIQY
ncbi:MAG: baeRF3 domain-containing protein [Flavisolibacter sp.]